jgi:hypothetical protein
MVAITLANYPLARPKTQIRLIPALSSTRPEGRGAGEAAQPPMLLLVTRHSSLVTPAWHVRHLQTGTFVVWVLRTYDTTSQAVPA